MSYGVSWYRSALLNAATRMLFVFLAALSDNWLYKFWISILNKVQYLTILILQELNRSYEVCLELNKYMHERVTDLDNYKTNILTTYNVHI